jgi:hypothetical protein
VSIIIAISNPKCHNNSKNNNIWMKGVTDRWIGCANKALFACAKVRTNSNNDKQ